MTQETIDMVFEVDGITYVHPKAREFCEMMDAWFNTEPIFAIIDDLEVFDEYGDNATPGGSFTWYGHPTTKGLMDD